MPGDRDRSDGGRSSALVVGRGGENDLPRLPFAHCSKSSPASSLSRGRCDDGRVFSVGGRRHRPRRGGGGGGGGGGSACQSGVPPAALRTVAVEHVDVPRKFNACTVLGVAVVRRRGPATLSTRGSRPRSLPAPIRCGSRADRSGRRHELKGQWPKRYEHRPSTTATPCRVAVDDSQPTAKTPGARRRTVTAQANVTVSGAWSLQRSAYDGALPTSAFTARAARPGVARA